MSTDTPDRWAESTFRDVTSYISRGKSPKYTDISELPVINQKAIRWHGLQDEHLKYIHPDQIDQWTSERFIQEGDVLWNSTGTGTIGRACLVQNPHLSPPKVVDSHVTIVRPNKEIIDPRYLFAWIRSPEIQGAIADLSSGSTNQIELNRSTIAETRLLLAPLSEQKRIADKLDALLGRVDACRERLDRVPQILKRFRQAVLSAAASGALTEEWRDRNLPAPGASRHPLDKEEGRGEGKELPEGWKYSSIAEIGKVCNGSTPSRKSPEYWNGDIPWVSSGEVRNNLIFETREKISRTGYDNSSVRLLPVGTVLLAMIGEGKTRGQTAILRIEATINQNSAAIIINPEIISSEYLWYWFQFQYEITRQSGSGSGPQALNCQRVRELPLILPPLPEQHEIVRRVETFFAFADRLEVRYTAGREQVDQLTPSLLDKAFRGELVPQDPNDEPAEKLLERIKMMQLVTVDKAKQGRKPKREKKTEVLVIDPSQIQADHLSSILKRNGRQTSKALWQESQLGIEDFYEQLRTEEARGLLREVKKGAEIYLEAA